MKKFSLIHTENLLELLEELNNNEKGFVLYLISTINFDGLQNIVSIRKSNGRYYTPTIDTLSEESNFGKEIVLGMLESLQEKQFLQYKFLSDDSPFYCIQINPYIIRAGVGVHKNIYEAFKNSKYAFNVYMFGNDGFVKIK